MEFVKNHKFLGVTLDSPKCTWRVHVDELKKSFVSRLNLMSNISGKDWGVDRNLLIKLYKALIRCKLHYVSLFIVQVPSLILREKRNLTF